MNKTSLNLTNVGDNIELRFEPKGSGYPAYISIGIEAYGEIIPIWNPQTALNLAYRLQDYAARLRKAINAKS